MELRCFGCDETLAAGSVDGLVDVFVGHAEVSHDWDYPIESIRNYARNIGEATIRLTGPTERLERIGAIEIHRVDESRIDDWLQLFDHDAFADNPEWGSCYCLDPHRPDGDEEPLWTESRQVIIDRLATGTTEGYLAYVDGGPAGWVNASRRSESEKYADVDPDGPPADLVIAVSCFVVAPPYRRHGVAESLLDRVTDDAKRGDAQWVEAYPKPEVASGDASNFRGTMRMYSSRGFTPIESRDRYVVVRRTI